MRVVVVGAGVIGLTCAVRLAEAGHETHVLARDLPPETTSAVAAALWYPYRALPQDRVDRAGRARTYDVLGELAADPATGVRVRDGVELLGADRARRAVVARGGPGAGDGARRRPPGYARGWRLPAPGGRDGRLPRLPRPPARGRRRHAHPALARRRCRRAASWSTATGLAVAGDGATTRRVHPVRGQVRPAGPGRHRGVAARVVGPDDARCTSCRASATSSSAAPPTRTTGTCGPTPTSPARSSTGPAPWCPALRKAEVLGHRVGLRPGAPRRTAGGRAARRRRAGRRRALLRPRRRRRHAVVGLRRRRARRGRAAARRRGAQPGRRLAPASPGSAPAPATVRRAPRGARRRPRRRCRRRPTTRSAPTAQRSHRPARHPAAGRRRRRR